MVVRKRKKSRKLRGNRTHGYGRVGQHRKSGSKGGYGAAGFHKHKWSKAIKYYGGYFGKHGFTRPPEIVPGIRGLNISRLFELIEELKASGNLRVEEGMPVVNLPELGFNKLLGSGRVPYPVKVVTVYASENAVKKIEEAGGKVVLIKEAKG